MWLLRNNQQSEETCVKVETFDNSILSIKTLEEFGTFAIQL